MFKTWYGTRREVEPTAWPRTRLCFVLWFLIHLLPSGALDGWVAKATSQKSEQRLLAALNCFGNPTSAVVRAAPKELAAKIRSRQYIFLLRRSMNHTLGRSKCHKSNLRHQPRLPLCVLGSKTVLQRSHQGEGISELPPAAFSQTNNTRTLRQKHDQLGAPPGPNRVGKANQATGT